MSSQARPAPFAAHLHWRPIAAAQTGSFYPTDNLKKAADGAVIGFRL